MSGSDERQYVEYECHDHVATSILFQSTGMANTAEVASQIARPSRSAAIRQAGLEAAARRERAAEMRHAVLRMPLGEPDGINIADELSWSRQEER